MSDSDDLSTPANFPPDAEIENCLRRIVREAIKKQDDITIKIARTRAEKELGLESGFLKDNDLWKQRSKDVISQAVDEPESPVKAKAKAGTKRKSDEVQPGRKRVKKSLVPDSNDSEEEASADNVAKEKPSELAHSIKGGKAQTKSDEDSALSEPTEDESEPAEVPNIAKSIEDDDSDLSSVIDDPPPRKSRRKKKSSSPIAAKTKPVKRRANPSTKEVGKDNKSKDLSPNEEEIKRLQSWLLKCGIRKLWHRELAPYPTPKEKIGHLKRMLEQVGMTPRYNAEKARQIKEARELDAELEAAREFNEQWGQKKDGSEAEESEDEKNRGLKKEVEAPVRRLKPKGLVDFGDSGEDSD